MKRLIAASAALAAMAAAAGAHTWLVRRGSACPVGHASAETLESARGPALQAVRGPATEMAPTHRAMGVVLDRTTEAELRAAAEARGGSCVEETEASLVRCTFARGEELVARFTPQRVVVGLDRVRYGLDGEGAAQELARVRAVHAACFGAPHRQWGEGTAAYLQGPLRQVGVEYRFSDLVVDVTATQMAQDGVVLREQVRSVPVGPRS